MATFTVLLQKEVSRLCGNHWLHKKFHPEADKPYCWCPYVITPYSKFYDMLWSGDLVLADRGFNIKEDLKPKSKITYYIYSSIFIQMSCITQNCKLIYLYLMPVVDNGPRCNLYNIVKRSKISSKMFAIVNLNTADDDWVVFSRNTSKMKKIILSVILISISLFF